MFSIQNLKSAFLVGLISMILSTGGFGIIIQLFESDLFRILFGWAGLIASTVMLVLICGILIVFVVKKTIKE